MINRNYLIRNYSSSFIPFHLFNLYRWAGIQQKTLNPNRIKGFLFLNVLEAGLEPARAKRPQDFKSGVSTNSTTRANPDRTVGLQSFFRTFVVWRARNGIRTRDPDLGKVVLYQLSYSRLYFNQNSQNVDWG